MGKSFTPQQVQEVLTTNSVQAVNDMFTKIESALEDVISRQGASPNVFSHDFDMNSMEFLDLGSNRGDEPDIYVDGMNLNVNVLELQRTEGELDVTLDLTPATTPLGFSGARALRLTAQNVATTAALVNTDELHDDGGWFDLSDPSKMVVPSGVQKVMVSFGWAVRPNISSTFPMSIDVEIRHYDSVGTQKSLRLMPKKAYRFPSIPLVEPYAEVSLMSPVVDVEVGDYFQVWATNHEASNIAHQWFGTLMGFVIERIA